MEEARAAEATVGVRAVVMEVAVREAAKVPEGRQTPSRSVAGHLGRSRQDGLDGSVCSSTDHLG